MCHMLGHAPHIASFDAEWCDVSSGDTDMSFQAMLRGAVAAGAIALSVLIARRALLGGSSAALDEAGVWSLAVAALAGAVAAFTSYRSIAREVRELSAVASALNRGHFDERTDPQQFDVLSQAARELDQLMLTLGRRELELRETATSRARDLREAMAVGISAAKAAETAARTRSDFLARMSHELRTPMNGVLGSLQLIRAGELSPKQREQCETAERSAAAMLDLIRDLLDLADLEAGQVDLEIAEFDFAQTLKGFVPQLADRALERGLHMISSIDPLIPPRLIGDAGKIERVLDCLLTNAIKFTPSGEVVLRASMLMMSAGTTRIHFEVSDTGIGISRDIVQSIFEPLRQRDGSVTRSHDGSGAGLTIARDLTEMLGGSLQVNSFVDNGTTFWFDLDLDIAEGGVEGAAATPEPIPTAVASTASASRDRQDSLGEATRVLVAEDNAVNREVVRAMLESLGCVVETVEDGHAAVDAAISDDYDLLLIDWHMPGISGLEACEAIREHEQRSGSATRVPIAALTASAMSGDRERCLLAGMDDYLSKPAKLGDLRALIDRLVKLEAPRAEDVSNQVAAFDDATFELLMSLEEAGASGLIGQIIELYLRDSRRDYARIVQAVHDGDSTSMADACAALSANSAALRAERLVSLAVVMEQSARIGDLAEAASRLETLEEEHGRVCEALAGRVRAS